MSKIAFPLGFKIVENTGTSNTGSPIDERYVFASQTDRTNYIDNYLYQGLLSYTVGLPYHVSGVTSDAGFYYRNSANSWVGLNSDTVDDKHAYGTIDSGTTTYTNPTTGTNIVDHINYQYSLISSLSTSRTWKAPVTNFADLATTYPTPSDGWTALVTSENSIYTYSGTAWVKTGGNIPQLSSTVSGIVSNTWYTTLNDLVTTPTKYSNQNSFSGIVVQNNGSGVINSPISSTTPTDSFTINVTGALTATVSGKVITINGTGGGGGVTTINDNFVKWDQTGQYYRFYSSKTEAGGSLSGGKFYLGTDTSTNNTRLNYDGYLYATKLYTGGVEVQKILPSQTGNSGKYLTTDGTNMSWGAITAATGLQTPLVSTFNITDSTTTDLTINYIVYHINTLTVNGIEYYEDIDFTLSIDEGGGYSVISFNTYLPYNSLMGDTIVKITYLLHPTTTIASDLNILTDASLVTYDNTGTSLTSTNVQDAVDELYQHVTPISGPNDNLLIIKNNRAVDSGLSYALMLATL